MKTIRDKIFISNSAWLLIQIAIFLLGTGIFYVIGIILACKFDMFDIPIYSCLLWFVIFISLKFKVEEEFADCIDS